MHETHLHRSPVLARGDRRRRFGPKAANLAALGQAGLPIPDGFCLDAEAYRLQIAALGLEASARGAFATDDRVGSAAARAADEARAARAADRAGGARARCSRRGARWSTRTGALTVVRSSALVEDRDGSSFAGQFESYLGLEGEAEFLTAVRACWAALWSTRALRYMATHDLDPAGHRDGGADPAARRGAARRAAA